MNTGIAIANEMAKESKSHGLDGSLVEPDWPPLTLTEVKTVLDQFPAAGHPIAILSTSPRPLSAASVVETDRGSVFIKRHARATRDAEGLAEEHRFMQHLHTNGIGVPRVLAAASGQSALETPEWTYEVHEIPAGLDLYEQAISWTPFLSAEHAHSAGAMLARMHVGAENFNAPRRKTQPLVASFTIFASEIPGDALRQYLCARPALTDDPQTRQDCERALELLIPFHQELKPHLSSLASLWTHNDLHASNLFWSNAGSSACATSVIDFGLADRTNAVHDLAHAIERNMVEWLILMSDPESGNRVAVHLDHLWAMLDGYERIRPLSAPEAAALAPMLAVCHAEFALSEADYFLGVLKSAEKARVATWDYLVGHARWFRGAGRHRLLDPIRRWADGRPRQAVRA